LYGTLIAETKSNSADNSEAIDNTETGIVDSILQILDQKKTEFEAAKSRSVNRKESDVYYDTLIEQKVVEEQARAKRKFENTLMTKYQFFKRLLKAIPGITFIKKYFIHISTILLIVLSAYLLYTIYENRRDRDRFFAASRLSIMDKEIQQICEYIEIHFSDPLLSIQSICEKFVTGEAFVKRLFLKEIGIPFDEFIAQVRVHHIQKKVKKNPGISDDELMVFSGFTEWNVLADTFRAITRKTIEEFKQQQAHKE
jgi:YesN/AraC family two-component response regulator